MNRKLWTIPLALLLFASCAHPPPTKTATKASIPPAAARGTLFRFAAYGDTRHQHDIHQDIVDKVLQQEPALVLQTGDLVDDGDVQAEWTKFDQITAGLRQRVPYYPARGNHDVGDHHYYEDRVTQPVLSGNRLYYSFEKGGVHFVSIDTLQSLKPGSPQYLWLENDLKTARDAGRFIIPFFHKAIFSIGQHYADRDVLALRPTLHRLFQKHGIILVFQGHDHIYYRTKRDGITYVVTGGGGAPLYDKYTEPGDGDVFEKVHHFCIADVTPNRVTVAAYRQDLSPVDRFEVPIKPPLTP